MKNTIKASTLLAVFVMMASSAFANDTSNHQTKVDVANQAVSGKSSL